MLQHLNCINAGNAYDACVAASNALTTADVIGTLAIGAAIVAGSVAFLVIVANAAYKRGFI